MRTQVLTLSALLLATAILTLSCEREKGDTVPPTIELKGPKEGDTLWVGSHIHFEADFADDVELGSYKIDIHPNFDGHTHKSLASDRKEWRFQQSWDFEADRRNAHMHHHHIEVPHQVDGHGIATGRYHFMVYCIDRAGNESWIAIGVVIAQGAGSHEGHGHAK